MNLRQQAELDLGFIIEDQETGFGWPVSVTNPSGSAADLIGLSDDISQIIDPDTGQMVTGRLASVVFRISSLDTAGLGLPRGIADSGEKPWVVEFDDINGSPYKFKVSEANPDRAIGVVVCFLELYE